MKKSSTAPKKAKAKTTATVAVDQPMAAVDSLLKAFATNEAINTYLLDGLSSEAWRAEPPNGKGRTIASIVAHVHNVRLMWLKAIKPGKLPDKLQRESVTLPQARKALAQSYRAMYSVLENSLRSDGKIRGFKPDVVGFIVYLLTHEAHHRGQISLLARQTGFAISQKTMFGMWEWGARSAEATD